MMGIYCYFYLEGSGEGYKTRSLWFVLVIKYYSSDKIKKIEMGWTCAYRILVEDLRERDHLEDLGIDGRTMLKWIFIIWDGEAWSGLI